MNWTFRPQICSCTYSCPALFPASRKLEVWAGQTDGVQRLMQHPREILIVMYCAFIEAEHDINNDLKICLCSYKTAVQ